MDKKVSVFNATIIFCLIICNACSREKYVFDNSPLAEFNIEYYDLVFNVDSRNKLFKSTQHLTITPSTRTKTIQFDIHSNLVIDNISVQEKDGNEIRVVSLQKLGNVKYNRGLQFELFSRYDAQLLETVIDDQKLTLIIDYHLKARSFQPNPGKELLKFVVSRKGTRALHPVSGIFPYFGSPVSAPFRIEINYPEGQYCCVPGNRIATYRKEGVITEIFEMPNAYIPVFYVGPGEKIIRNQNDVTVEYYLAPGQSIDEEAINTTFTSASLFSERFGNTGKDYRIAYVDIMGSSITGESKGNAIYLAYRKGDNHEWDEETRLNFMQLISHEFFHNWNLWYVNWQGRLYEWFVEGSAGFMSAWACEKIVGNEAGNRVRSGFTRGYSNNKGYNSVSTLENVQKTGTSEISLIYSYGALVWEQLRQKLGDEALFAGLGEFIAANGYQQVRYRKLLEALQAHTEVPVEKYLNQWIKNNAKIDLLIDNVSIMQRDTIYETTIGIKMESENDYEIFTEIGYKTSELEEMTNIEVHITKTGIHRFQFISAQKPMYIQIDPDFRVPQTDIDNDNWSEDEII